jgi:hypothetical protein
LIAVSIVRPGESLDPTTAQACWRLMRAMRPAAYRPPRRVISASTPSSTSSRNPVKSAVDLDLLGIIFFSPAFEQR